MRAMTINADVVSGVAGYIEEGDLVDVLAITEAESAESADTIKVNGKTKTVKNTITYTAVKNVKVLKLGDITTEKGTVYSTVTLQLSPKQCFRLFTAENNGTLRICLRQKGDTGDINLGPYNYEDLIK
jgi:Flp pilus assembly protein CpaB